jgi:hypothetical protein
MKRIATTITTRHNHSIAFGVVDCLSYRFPTEGSLHNSKTATVTEYQNIARSVREYRVGNEGKRKFIIAIRHKTFFFTFLAKWMNFSFHFVRRSLLLIHLYTSSIYFFLLIISIVVILDRIFLPMAVPHPFLWYHYFYLSLTFYLNFQFRQLDKKIEYLVKWTGCDEAQNSCEPHSKLK